MVKLLKWENKLSSTGNLHSHSSIWNINFNAWSKYSDRRQGFCTFYVCHLCRLKCKWSKCALYNPHGSNRHHVVKYGSSYSTDVGSTWNIDSHQFKIGLFHVEVRITIKLKTILKSCSMKTQRCSMKVTISSIR